MNTTALAVPESGALSSHGPMTADDVCRQVQLIQQVMERTMIKGTHFGVVPGCGDKPALLKAGAEKLGMTFRLVPTFKIDRVDLGDGHREYTITCALSNSTGEIVGEGVGSCSTLEKKYRWRNNDSFEVTDEPIPADSKERKSEYRRQGYGMKKVDERWVWVKYSGGTERTENPDIADTWNTVLKMAKKRAHVDAILTTTAASDIFTQDIDETLEEPKPATAKPAPAKQAAPPADRAKVAAAVIGAIRAAKSEAEIKAAMAPLPNGFGLKKDEHFAAILEAARSRKLAIQREEIDTLAEQCGFTTVELAMAGQTLGIADIDAMTPEEATKLADSLRLNLEELKTVPA